MSPFHAAAFPGEQRRTGTPDLDTEESGAPFPSSAYSLLLKSGWGEEGSIYFWVLNDKGVRASTVGAGAGGEIKLISRGSITKFPWQVSFMLHLFYRLSYFCLSDVLHI